MRLHLPFPVVLASGSPRRQELLKDIVESFIVDVPDIDENINGSSDPWAVSERLALAKALAVFETHPDTIVIGGDTVVAVEAKPNEFHILGKPESVSEAKEMLARLSGITHFVITGVAIRTPQGTEAFTVTTKVTFRELSPKEIADYVASGEPMDKAGAYAIQGGAASFAESLDGSLSNVIGLPLEELELRLVRYAQMVAD